MLLTLEKVLASIEILNISFAIASIKMDWI